MRRKRKKMNSVDDENMDEIFDDGGKVKIPINDKRRFNEQGEKVREDTDVKP